MDCVVDGRCALSPGDIDELMHFMASPILVVGAGTGVIPGYLAGQGHDVVAIDSCPEMVNLTEEQANWDGHDFTIMHMDGRELTFPEKSFSTVICSSGVITQSTLHQPWIEVILKKCRQALVPRGKLIAAYCLETEENHPYREIYERLHLNRVPSKNTLFLGVDTLEDVRQRIVEQGILNENDVHDLFIRYSGIITQHHRMIRAVEKELRRLNVEPEAFMASYFAFEKPYLTSNEQSYLMNQVDRLFQHTGNQLLSDGETAVITGTR